MFSGFVEEIKREIQKGLPGFEAQALLAPEQRKKPKEWGLREKDTKESGVLILLYPYDDVPYFVLIRRPKYPGVHSGQISLPGGKREDGDGDLNETALRETEEEIGVERGNIRILGSLSRLYIPPSKFWVEPVVSFMEFKPKFTPEEKEVTEIIEVSVEKFLGASRKEGEVQVHYPSRKIHTPYYEVEGKIVWGATAMILSEFKEILKRVRL